MTWIGRDCDTTSAAGPAEKPRDQNLWPELEGIVTQLGFLVFFLVFINQNLWPELEGIVTLSLLKYLSCSNLSEFMTWIGRDCDVTRIPQSTPEGASSEFMTWIGRDCDKFSGVLSILLFYSIRIYDLNWKGLWRQVGRGRFRLWPPGSEFMTWIGRDCDNWPFSAKRLCHQWSEFMTWIGRDCDSSRASFNRVTSFKSEFMTWIGRDCDPTGHY